MIFILALCYEKLQRMSPGGGAHCRMQRFFLRAYRIAVEHFLYRGVRLRQRLSDGLS